MLAPAHALFPVVLVMAGQSIGALIICEAWCNTGTGPSPPRVAGLPGPNPVAPHAWITEHYSMAIHKIRKRDGTAVAFRDSKIVSALARAMADVGSEGDCTAEELAAEVKRQLEARFPTRTGRKLPTIEEIQDQVEEVLVVRGMPRTAKSYILYRQRRADLRQTKRALGIEDDLKLRVGAAAVLQQRYLKRDWDGKVVETPTQLFRRVARAVAEAETRYGERPGPVEDAFYKAMVAFDFLPNSPTLMNAGTDVGQLSACFVLPVEDSIDGVFEALKCMALVHKTGGGTGFSFSALRPRGDLVRTTGGVASGPLSFIRIFDLTTEVVRQGGRRRGANMGILRCDHPDILDFISAKEQEGVLSNFNLSVGVTDAFMEAVRLDQRYELRNPRTGAVSGHPRAREVFRLIAAQAWRCGDPGVVFLDTVNRANPTPSLGPLEATNPCGEQPLLPWENCNLGSINLKNMVNGKKLDWRKLRRTVTLAVRFLDDVIDVNSFPLEQTAQVSRGNRKIGLGVMGLADALLLMGIPYDSDRAVKLAERIAATLEDQSHKASAALARKRGNFPNWGRSTHASGGPARNATTTSIAPTGTISLIAGCSSGIEPLFSVAYVRRMLEGQQMFECNAIFERVAREQGFFSQELLDQVARTGSIQQLEQIPKKLRRLFVTAFDIAPERHIQIQAAFQRHCDNAVSKTINVPRDATMEQVEQAFMLAYQQGCKGITVYRDGSRQRQVLNLAGETLAAGHGLEHVTLGPECGSC